MVEGNDGLRVFDADRGRAEFLHAELADYKILPLTLVHLAYLEEAGGPAALFVARAVQTDERIQIVYRFSEDPEGGHNQFEFDELREAGVLCVGISGDQMTLATFLRKVIENWHRSPAQH